MQVHGSAPDIAGRDIANPLAMVLSAAMMCRYGLDLPKVHWPTNSRERCEEQRANLLKWFSNRVIHFIVMSAQVAERLEKAVTAALENGYRTADLYSAGTQKVGCSEMGNVLQDMLGCGQQAT